MNEMPLYEARAAAEYSWYAGQEGWEQARLEAYVTAQCNSSKTLKITDIASFPWEKSSAPTTLSDDEFDALRQRAQHLIDNNLI